MNTTIPMNAEILLDGSQLTLGEAIVTAQDWLTAFANSETFLPTVNLTFGNHFDAKKLTKLRQEWAAKEFNSLPTIEIRTATELNGANGAFAAATNTIYLSQDYIVENSDNLQRIVDVLLEEIGHAVDAQINSVDAPGDEGAIFSALVQRVELDQPTLEVLKAEDDTAMITLDNQVIQVEKQGDQVLLAPFLSQIETFLDQIQSKVNDQVFGANGLPNIGDLDGLPLFGNSLQDADNTQFIEDVVDQLRRVFNDKFGDAASAAIEEIQQAISDVFGSDTSIRRDGNNLIFDVNKTDTKTFENYLPSDINLKPIHINFRAPETQEHQSPKATVDLTYNLDFGIGIDLANLLDSSPENDFFFDVSSGTELGIDIKPQLLPEASASFGFILADTKDIGSQFNFSLDLSDGNDNKLQFNEINTLQTNTNGNADIKFNLISEVNIPSIGALKDFPSVNTLPQLGTDLIINWDFAQDALAPNVRLENMTVEAGSLLTDWLNPLVQPIRKVTEPFGKVYDALTIDLPIIGDVNLLSIAKGIDIPVAENLVKAGLLGIDFLGKLDQLLDSVSEDINSLDELKFDIGDVDLGSFDLRNLSTSAEQADPNATNSTTLEELVNLVPGGESFQPYREFLDQVSDDQVSDLLSLPILEDPELIAKMFLGQAYENTISGERVKFFSFELPKLDLDIESSARFDFPGLPISFGLGGSISADLQLGFSYDSLGIEKWANTNFDFNQVQVLSDGLLVDDHRIDGVDQPEGQVTGRLFAESPELGIPGILSVGIDGGIETSLFADLEDLGEAGDELGDSDGQIRGTEILTIANFNPDCLLDLSGQVNAFIGGYVRYLFWKDRKDFGKFNITNFEIGDCPHTKPILSNEGSENFTGGVLELNAGSRADKRLFVSTTDEAETFSLIAEGNPISDNVSIVSFGHLQIFSGVSKIVADMGEFDDIIDVANIAIPVEFVGGNGNDKLSGGEGDDKLSGDSGNDRLFGGGGNDSLLGASGNDLIFAGEGDDIISGGDNSDNSENLLSGDELFGEGGADTIDGGDGSDFIDGGTGNDQLYGDTNDDQLGNDIILGGDGDDKLYGLGGNDILRSGDGSDSLYGGAGNDELLGDGNDDFLIGEAGNDNISGGEGNDTISYNNSPSGVAVNIDEEKAYTNTGDVVDIEPIFTINAAEAKDGFGTKDSFNFKTIMDIYDEATQTVIEENLDISGQLENIIGSQFNDILIGSSQANHIQGWDDNDLFIGNGGNDHLDGGNNIDTVSYSRDPGAVNVNLSQNKARDGFGSIDEIYNIENVVGSAFNDEIIGDTNANIVTAGVSNDIVKGGAGNDQLYGESDDDFLMGEAGDDLIDGNNDVDTVSYENSPNGVIVNIDEQLKYQNSGGYTHETITSGNPIPTDTEPNFTINPGTALDGFGNTDTLKNLENIIGSESDDILIGNSLDNHLHGLAGDDLFIGNAGNDYFDGGNGFDTVSYRRDPGFAIVNLEQNQATDGFDSTDQIYNIENVIGSNSSDRVIGDANANTIITGTGDDWVEARDGNDIIFGEQGKDTLFAENGNDFLVGGKDADSLNGGAGNDTASYFTAASRVAVSLTTGKGWVGDAKGDRIEAIENLEGSDYEDLLIGNSINNTLSGLAGNDLIYAKAGDDILDGGDGSDRLIAGDGNDKLYGQAGEDLLKGQAGDDLLDGGDGNDQLYGHKGNDTLDGNAGNDYLKAGNGNDYLKGSQGNDQLYSQNGEDTLEGGTGDDLLDGGNRDDILSGGDGDDQLYGQNGNDTLNGNTGNDYLEAGNGNDQLTGGEGNDRLYGQKGNDTLNGDAGNDLLDGGKGNDQLTGGDGNDQLYGQQGKDILEGGTGNDSLWGDKANDILLGQAGNDYLDGGKGDDQLDGGAGNDRLYGQQGEDILKGGTGDDYLDGGSDNDELYGNQGNDRIYGQEGYDTLDGEDGHDFLDGGLGDDFIYGKQGSDRLYGQQGQDYLDGGIGDDRLDAGDGDDQLYGQDGRDYLDGGAGDDFLWGGDDADKLLGQSGNDYLEAGSGNDQLIGGLGNDQLYGQDGDDTIDAGAGHDYLEGGLGNDQLTGGEGNDYLYGQDGEDILNGDAGNDNLYGGANNDQLTGGDGNDLLYGEEGNDTINAGTGDDYLEGGFGDDQLIGGLDNDQLYGQEGNDSLDGHAGNDYLEGGLGDDQLAGGLGDDYLQGQDGNDTIDAGAGNDYLVGGDGIDILFGQAGDDYLEGGDGEDTLYGNTGNDELIGGNGNDQLYAGAGDNILNGGLGQDLLYSGSGRDMFVLTTGMGEDTIFDFTVGFDYLGLANGLTFEDLTITQGSGDNAENTEIRIQESEEFLTSLVGVQADTLSFWDFAVI
jgi:Ca2+-binding RTX toxin-like protein